MHNRKYFLKQVALLGTGLFVTHSSIFGARLKKKIGLQLYTLRKIIESNPKEVIQKVANIGYRDIETYGYSPKDGFWGISPKEFKYILDKNNLKSSSGHYDFSNFIKTGKTDEVYSIIEAAKILKQEYIVLPFLTHNLRTSVDSFKLVADKANKIAEACKKSGLKFAYHNHNFEFNNLGNGQTGYEILLQNTDPSLVQFELDLYWVVRSKVDPITLFKENPGRFPMWHVKDMDKIKPQLNTEIGNGSIDFKSIFKYIELSGLKYIFMEQENFIKEPYDSIIESFNYIKSELV